MTKLEETLLFVLSQTEDANAQAVCLEKFIQENGPLSEEAAVEVRKILKGERS